MATLSDGGTLSADAVSFAYRSATVVRDVTLTASAAECIGILGPNGAGKTTLLHLLAGLLTPTRGRVYLDGQPLDRLPRAAVARRLALVPQETTLTFDYSVREVALMGRYPHLGAFGLESADDLAIVEHSLTSTGTGHLADRPFSTLSGGEKQRVVIASALAQLRPAGAATTTAAPGTVLLLDEPTASLDLGYQLEIAGLLRRLHRLANVAMVVSTHDLDFAVGVCNRLVLIRDGMVIAAGPTDAVLTTENIRTLYGIDADVARHEATGRLLVVPLATTRPGPS